MNNDRKLIRLTDFAEIIQTDERANELNDRKLIAILPDGRMAKVTKAATTGSTPGVRLSMSSSEEPITASKLITSTPTQLYGHPIVMVTEVLGVGPFGVREVSIGEHHEIYLHATPVTTAQLSMNGITRGMNDETLTTLPVYFVDGDKRLRIIKATVDPNRGVVLECSREKIAHGSKPVTLTDLIFDLPQDALDASVFCYSSGRYVPVGGCLAEDDVAIIPLNPTLPTSGRLTPADEGIAAARADTVERLAVPEVVAGPDKYDGNVRPSFDRPIPKIVEDLHDRAEFLEDAGHQQLAALLDEAKDRIMSIAGRLAIYENAGAEPKFHKITSGTIMTCKGDDIAGVASGLSAAIEAWAKDNPDYAANVQEIDYQHVVEDAGAIREHYMSALITYTRTAQK